MQRATASLLFIKGGQTVSLCCLCPAWAGGGKDYPPVHNTKHWRCSSGCLWSHWTLTEVHCYSRDTRHGCHTHTDWNLSQPLKACKVQGSGMPWWWEQSMGQAELLRTNPWFLCMVSPLVPPREVPGQKVHDTMWWFRTHSSCSPFSPARSDNGGTPGEIIKLLKNWNNHNSITKRELKREGEFYPQSVLTTE